MTTKAKTRTSTAKCKRVSGPDRGKRCSGEALRKAVRRLCLQKWREGIGREMADARGLSEPVEWREGRRYDRPLWDAEREQDYRAAFNALRKAIAKVAQLSEKVRPMYGAPIGEAPAGPCERFIGWWAPKFIAPLSKHAAMQGDFSQGPVEHLEGRARLVQVLDDYNNFGLPNRPDGSSRFLTTYEMAIVSLLHGNWSVGNSVTTAAEVIRQEEKQIAKHVKRHGRQPMHLADAVLRAKRGPIR